MSETQRRIRTHVYVHAGVHFNELVRESAFAPGQVQHHIRQLIDDNELVRREFYGRTHYYPPEYNKWEQAALALFRRETVRELVVYLIKHGPAHPGDVAEALGIARSTLEYHLDRLVERDIVQKTYGDRNRVTLRLITPERTGELLSTIEPTVLDCFLNGVTRFDGTSLETASEPY